MQIIANPSRKWIANNHGKCEFSNFQLFENFQFRSMCHQSAVNSNGSRVPSVVLKTRVQVGSVELKRERKRERERERE